MNYDLRRFDFLRAFARFDDHPIKTIDRARGPAESTRYAHPNNIIPVSSDVAGRVNAITMASMFNRARTLRRAVVDPNE